MLKGCELQPSGLCMHVILAQGAHQDSLLCACVCDLTLFVSLVEFLGRLRVTVSECEASSCGCIPERHPHIPE